MVDNSTPPPSLFVLDLQGNSPREWSRRKDLNRIAFGEQSIFAKLQANNRSRLLLEANYTSWGCASSAAALGHRGSNNWGKGEQRAVVLRLFCMNFTCKQSETATFDPLAGLSCFVVVFSSSSGLTFQKPRVNYS